MAIDTPTPAQQHIEVIAKMVGDMRAYLKNFPQTTLAWTDIIEQRIIALDYALAALEAVEAKPAAYMHDYGDRVRVVWNTAWSKYPAGTKFYADGPADAVEVSRED